MSVSDLLTALARFEVGRGLVVARTAMDGLAATPVNGTLAIPPSALVFVRSSSPQRIERLVGGGAVQVIKLHFLSKNELCH